MALLNSKFLNNNFLNTPKECSCRELHEDFDPIVFGQHLLAEVRSGEHLDTACASRGE